MDTENILLIINPFNGEVTVGEVTDEFFATINQLIDLKGSAVTFPTMASAEVNYLRPKYKKIIKQAKDTE
jgi:hypothetical protein